MTPAAPRWLTFALSILAALAALALPTRQAHAQFCGAVITTSNQTVCAGDSVTLNAVIANLGGGTVRWFRGSTLVQTGGTSYTIPSATPTDTGSYTVRLTGGAFNCNETSSAVSVTVRADVVITTQPVDRTVCFPSDPTFTVVATGAAPLTYRWRRNGVNLADGETFYGTTISGATTPTLRLFSPNSTDEGDYTCLVTNAGGCDSEISAAATLVVNAVPSIQVQPAQVIACQGDNASFAVTATGGDLSYQWLRNGVNVVNSSRITGATSPFLRISSVTAADAGAYSCYIFNSCGNRTTLEVQLAVFGPIQFSQQPADRLVCSGQTTSFSVLANASATLSYQWRRNGVNLVNGVNANGTTISGATTPTLTLTSVDTADTGGYSCLVTYICDTETTVTAQLTVLSTIQFSQQPSSRTVCPGGGTSFSVVAAGPAPFTYQWRRNGVNLVNGPTANGGTVSGATTSTLTLTSIPPGDAGLYSCLVQHPCDSALSGAATLVVATPVTITTQPVSAAVCQGSTHVFTIAVSGTPAPSIQWQRGGVPIANGPTGNGSTISGANTASLTISNVQPGDAVDYRARVFNVNSSSSICSTEFSRTVVLTVAAPLNVTGISPSVSACPGDSRSITVTATGGTAFQWRRNGTDLTSGPQPGGGSYAGVNSSTLSITGLTTALGGDYTCVVSNPCGPVISPISTITVRDAVSILTSPSDQTITEGGATSFTVSASGTGPLSFQWQRNSVDLSDGASPNGTMIAGATTATLNLSAVSILDAGEFRCVVTSTCGSVNTLPALLTVTPVSSACSVADIVAIGGTPPPDGLLTGDDFVAFIAAFAAGDLLADIVAIGGVQPPDGLITGDDFNAFIAAFAAGCP